jgi:hypothetical protein
VVARRVRRGVCVRGRVVDDADDEAVVDRVIGRPGRRPGLAVDAGRIAGAERAQRPVVGDRALGEAGAGHRVVERCQAGAAVDLEVVLGAVGDARGHVELHRRGGQRAAVGDPHAALDGLARAPVGSRVERRRSGVLVDLDRARADVVAGVGRGRRECGEGPKAGGGAKAPDDQQREQPLAQGSSGSRGA